MQVKDLKEMLDRLPEDAEVLVDFYGQMKSVSAYESLAVAIVDNPPWYHKFEGADALDIHNGTRCGHTKDAHKEPKGMMAASDMRKFITITDHPRTPKHLRDHAVKCLVIDT